MTDLTEQLRLAVEQADLKEERTSALWEGPAGSGPQGGVTYSLISRFLTCRERFRLYVVEGLRGRDAFNLRLEFGNFWHLAEEAHAAKKDWREAVNGHVNTLFKRYPFATEQVIHWATVCETTFPIYLDYWAARNKEDQRIPIFQEKPFSVYYELPDRRRVRLRGKWDNVDICGVDASRGVEITDHKTKGEIDEEKLTSQLTGDLQTMLYAVAFEQFRKQMDPKWSRYVGPLKTIRYNVIRRPLSGGVGSIRQHKPTKKNPQGETKDEFYERLAEIIKAAPETYFMRWRIEISEDDIQRFKDETLNPILTQIVDWFDWISECRERRYPSHRMFSNLHWRHPFGARNLIDEGGTTDLDNYLACGTMAGLQQVDTLFPEL